MHNDHEACYRALSTRDFRFDGVIFVGVQTTGIYCRPICPARTPLAKNVVFFQSSPAAISAGFRPCIRCRPDTAPDKGAWKGVSSTVSRAMSLIAQGALDHGDVEQLAHRLGVGARHLRRLFNEHVGATPAAVAQSQRILRAKQLIQDTDMSMTDVAFASGFNSIRRFNECFSDMYGRAPSDLRSSTLSRTSLEVVNDGVSVVLNHGGSYDWDAMIGYLAARQITGVEEISNNRYHRVIRKGNSCGVVEVGRKNARQIEAIIRFPEIQQVPDILESIRQLFDMRSNLKAINGQLEKDALLAPLIGLRPGLRSPGAWSAFELAVRAILGQQITVSAAAQLGREFCNRYGMSLVSGSDGLERAFPEPGDVAEADLSDLPMPRARSRSLQQLARLLVDDPMLLSPRASLDVAIEQLTAIPGIGPWTAQYIALRAMREPDAFPASDVAIRRALEPEFGYRPSVKEVEARAETWRPWRGYAAQHLWASLSEK